MICSIKTAVVTLGMLGSSIFLTGCMKDTPKAAKSELEKSTEALEPVVIENIADNVIVATYRNLSDETQALAKLASRLRQNPTQANLEAVQKKWKEARVPWESTEGFLFGPVDSLGVDPAIDSWPLSKIDLDKILRDQPNITADFVRGLGTDVQGFHTAEYLLFGSGIDSNNKIIQEMTAPQLNYLEAVTAVLAEQTEKLYRSWTERHDPSDINSKPYIELIRNPGPGNPFYPSRSSILQEYIQGMIKIAAEVGRGKISDPLGGSVDAADPTQVESQFSWNSLIDFQNNVRSLRNLYTGDYLARGAGIDEIVKLRKTNLNSKILDEIDAAEKAIADIAGPEGLSFTKAIKDQKGRERARSAISALQVLEATLQSELLPLFN